MKIILSLLLVALPIIGLVDSGFVTLETGSGQPVACGANFDCESVLTSDWAHIGPIPISALGFLFYAVVLILALLNYLEIDIKSAVDNFANKLKLKKDNVLRFVTIPELLLIITFFGFLFSLYLMFLMQFVIKAWCLFCLISAGTSTSLFIVMLLYFIYVETNSPFVIKTIVIKKFHILYILILKKIFFLFDAESVHNAMTNVGKNMGENRLLKTLISTSFSFSHEKVHKEVDGVLYPNPVGLAAGFDYNGDLTQVLSDVGFGFHTIGTVTYDYYEGNPKPRLGRFPNSKSLLVNKGLKSLGAKKIIQKLENLKFMIPTGISIASTNKHFDSTHDQILNILKTFFLFEKSGVQHSYYELNISCPNTFGGEPFTTPKRLKLLLTALEKLQISKPTYVKMPIDQSELETLKLLRVINKFTIAGVVIGNLTKDRKNPDVDPQEKKEWKNKVGNLSGSPTRKRSNKLIKLTKKHYKDRFTIIGTGGIMTPKDAVEKMKLGADLVQLITGMIFEGPQLLGMINLKLAQISLNKKTN
jgi:dihydroorotate dehydrogenase